jgi:hypothetical protein
LFSETIGLAQGIFGDQLFRPWNPRLNRWAPKPQIAYADALMVALSERLDQGSALFSARKNIVEGARRLVEEAIPGTFTGQGNTREAVQTRINAFRQLFKTIVEGI